MDEPKNNDAILWLLKERVLSEFRRGTPPEEAHGIVREYYEQLTSLVGGNAAQRPSKDHR